MASLYYRPNKIDFLRSNVADLLVTVIVRSTGTGIPIEFHHVESCVFLLVVETLAEGGVPRVEFSHLPYFDF